MDIEKLRIHGHRDKFTNWDEQWEKMFWHAGAYRKMPIYAWMTGDGTILGEVSKDYESILAKKEEMQKFADEQEEIVRLIEFEYESTKERLMPPPEPREGGMSPGGHALGGPPEVETLEDAVEVMRKILDRQYAPAKGSSPTSPVAIGVDDDIAFAQHLNVRCWLKKCNDQGKDDYQREKRWSAYVTMVRNWNYDYHDVHIGSFFSADDAIHSALTAFIYYQMIEQYMEEY